MELSFIQCGFAEAFDYCQFMIIKLNSRQWIAKHYCFPGKETEDLERAEKIADMYSGVDERLKIFFDCEYKNTSFLSQYLYGMKYNLMVHSLEELQSVIEKDVHFKDKLLQFYLGAEYSDNHEIMHSLMMNHEELDSSYKEMLMYFLVFQDEYMNLLFDSMQCIKVELKKVYNMEAEKLHQLEIGFNFNMIAERRRTLKKWMKELQKVEIYFSYCNQYVVMVGDNQSSSSWMILGCEYVEAIERKWSAEIPLDKIGNALGDEMRIQILKEVQRNGEMSAPQIAKILKLPSSAIFYHLDVLKKAYVLCSRMEGRTAYYWLDQRTFEYAINELKNLGGL